MRYLRLFSFLFVFGILSACGDLGPVATDYDDDEEICSEETPEYCEGYMGSDT